MLIRPHTIFAFLTLASWLTPALAQESGFLGGTGQPIDTAAPIEIAADALEVVQAEQVAIFSGSVDAMQGEMRLQASELRVHYSTGSGTGGDISQLNANGNVHVSSARETARGDWAIYNVGQETVTMGGNVVLTQGENVIQGDRLTIDLASGRSIIEGGASMETEESDDGRVRGTFTIPSDSSDEASDDPPSDETSSDGSE